MAGVVQQMGSMTQEPPILQVWQQLHGTWHLNRKLHSTNAAEPSGNCEGTATFTIRRPTIFVDEDGVLQNASQELLYSENGDFQMIETSGAAIAPTFSFSRKYIWRLKNENPGKPEISIWFVKPGSEQIDYLFHKALLQHATQSDEGSRIHTSVECSGGHLCIDDYYSSMYTFLLEQDGRQSPVLRSWQMLHEIQGPQKDQIIETTFTRG